MYGRKGRTGRRHVREGREGGGARGQEGDMAGGRQVEDRSRGKGRAHCDMGVCGVGACGALSPKACV
jgi:hypothetical protein